MSLRFLSIVLSTCCQSPRDRGSCCFDAVDCLRYGFALLTTVHLSLFRMKQMVLKAMASGCRSPNSENMADDQAHYHSVTVTALSKVDSLRINGEQMFWLS